MPEPKRPFTKTYKNTMNINELKVGDRVKYRHILGNICEGNILLIDEYQNYYFSHTSSQSLYKTKKEDIISKLEPLPPQYKEIKIEHNQPTEPPQEEIIDFNDLKIGDCVNYKYPDSYNSKGWVETTGHILSFEDSFVYISGDSLTGSKYKIPMLDILYKLDYLWDYKKWKKTRVMWGTKPPIIKNKEIPIEKEKDYIVVPDDMQMIFESNKDYKKRLEKENPVPQPRCGEKSAPKSFKFDFCTSSKTIQIQVPKWVKLGGTMYTIEIKEKE